MAIIYGTRVYRVLHENDVCIGKCTLNHILIIPSHYLRSPTSFHKTETIHSHTLGRAFLASCDRSLVRDLVSILFSSSRLREKIGRQIATTSVAEEE